MSKFPNPYRWCPKNISKYLGDYKEIWVRSSWERKFFEYCDRTETIVKWGSEEIAIPYISPIDGKYHRYFVDAILYVLKPDGKTYKYLIEIKPEIQCYPPKVGKKTKTYINAVCTYGVNMAKWDAASKWAKTHGSEFMILTEKHLGIKT